MCLCVSLYENWNIWYCCRSLLSCRCYCTSHINTNIFNIIWMRQHSCVNLFPGIFSSSCHCHMFVLFFSYPWFFFSFSFFLITILWSSNYWLYYWHIVFAINTAAAPPTPPHGYSLYIHILLKPHSRAITFEEKWKKKIDQCICTHMCVNKWQRVLFSLLLMLWLMLLHMNGKKKKMLSTYHFISTNTFISCI